jgi:type II restriction/modification system DNA methylase subunit YeeA
MNKSALKTFATSARKELLKKVAAKAMKIGITEETIKKADVESSDAIFIDGRQLSKEEKTQRDKLIARINQIGFKHVMEEVAYTWFNRFTALRFMEVNDYLPTGVRVLSSSNPNSADPDMLNEALELDLEAELDKEHIYDMKLNNETEELFKYLIIKHCNDLNRFLPFMFETIDDYTEILFPEGLLAKETFIRQMTDTDFIPEDNWQKVEIIGWLYQYYIAEEKDRVIQAKKKYKTEEIPFATQLFTPDWIVRYMVQNSLGRYWVESHPEHRELLGSWEFYLENPNHESDFEKKIAPYINKELKVEDIKCFDPAMGSGHILVYMFDVLYEIYSKCGYMDREIPRLIIENNLYGLDIDDRAYQLACFSVVMKALEYNSRFFRSIEREGLSLNLASIQETNIFDDEDFTYIAGDTVGDNFECVKNFFGQFKDAKTIGSLIEVVEYDKEFIEKRLFEVQNNPVQNLFEEDLAKKMLSLLPSLIKQAKIMLMEFDVIVTNPPYMGFKYMNNTLSNFIKQNYADVKSDIFPAFMDICVRKVKLNGQLGFLTPSVWLFIESYEKLRNNIANNKSLSSLIQLEYNAFPEACVPVCTFTLRNYFTELTAECIRLSEFKGIDIQETMTLQAVKNPSSNYRYSIQSKEFKKIPGSAFAYWASETMLNIFTSSETIEEQIKFRQGMATSDNNRFLRYWHEVDQNKVGYGIKSREEAKISKLKWFPYNKGGGYRKWYGNNDYVVNWENDGEEMKEFTSKLPQGTDVRLKSKEYYFKRGLTWSALTSGNLSVRYSDNGYIFDTKGSMGFPYNENNFNYIFGLLNSKVSTAILEMLAPTLDFNLASMKKIPYIMPNHDLTNINKLVDLNILISREDWDSYETSWDFKKHPYLNHKGALSKMVEAHDKWEENLYFQINKLKANEEELNSIFNNIYGLQGELSPYIEEKELAISKIDRRRDVKSLISYVMGCLFGRYSLDKDGLIYAGGEFELENYKTFIPDKDNIVPILSGSYFEDDIVSKFIDFVQVTFGNETLAENLDFVADNLGKKKGETSKETLRRYFLNDFYKDHVQTYKKRPIYWLFTSGKQKAFNCLIYMHRYDKTTLSRIRTDYLHEYQIRLDAEKKDLLSIIEGDYTTMEISNAKKELKALDKKIEELKEYDELLHHMADMQIEINLDDGVAVNYDKFKGLVAKI